ncbi:hypothetical protein [Leptolyngbya sp. FACHB-8]|uniref:hypothetical protein n=1 Tax=unclassified Leptolyngbya TaxID=2650499 RepID=UPI00168A115E|nr:hypothetical protein [Leptolyngbya sp. FACHB-8]MBD1909771.1 hypothetical protein [Leptolyngbya sp. FACHB-8]
MEVIQELRKQEWCLSETIAIIKTELANIGGHTYRECWLDSYQDLSVAKRYTRLRWFVDVATQKKGARILKRTEVEKAARAIALWAELAWLEGELNRAGLEIQTIEKTMI